MSQLPSPQQLLRRAAAVCLDVDSTVCTDEGVDRLAVLCGVGQQVADWTNRAMGGGVSFEASLEARLGIMKPTRAQIAAMVAEGINLTPGVTAFVRLLRDRGVAVFLVTGGLRPLVEPVAGALGLPPDHVFANELIHDADGNFVNFDRQQPTSHSGGKREVLQLLKDRFRGGIVVMIGDGVTDMEARPPADLFIGFGGNVVRDKVRDGCDWFAKSFAELTEAFGEVDGGGY